MRVHQSVSDLEDFKAKSIIQLSTINTGEKANDDDCGDVLATPMTTMTMK